MERALLEGASGVFQRAGRKAAEVDNEQVKAPHVPLTGKTYVHV
jgi:transposase